MLRNMLGPVFNLYLHQFLTYKICYFCFLLKPLFISVFSKNAKFKETQKKTLFVNTIVLTALVKMSVFCIFSFLDVFDWFTKNQKYKKPKQAKQKTRTKGRQKMQSKTNEIL